VAGAVFGFADAEAGCFREKWLTPACTADPLNVPLVVNGWLNCMSKCSV
jgi:hypothetical protein